MIDGSGNLTIQFTLQAGTYNLEAAYLGNSQFKSTATSLPPLIVKAATPTPTSPTPTSPTPTSPTPTSPTPTSPTPTSPTPTSPTPTSPTPTGTPPQAGGSRALATHSKKGLTAVTLSFNVPLSRNSATNTGLYTAFGAVKKKGKTTYTKSVGGVKLVTLSGDGKAVTINLGKPFKGVVQVTGLEARAHGRRRLAEHPECCVSRSLGQSSHRARRKPPAARGWHLAKDLRPVRLHAGTRGVPGRSDL